MRLQWTGLVLLSFAAACSKGSDSPGSASDAGASQDDAFAGVDSASCALGPCSSVSDASAPIDSPIANEPDARVAHDGGATEDAGLSSTDDGGTASPPPQVPSGWSLALNDDFTGSTLGPSWSIGTNLDMFDVGGTTYWTSYVPQESEYLTASMVQVQSSNLILSTMPAASAIAGPQGSKSFISGYVTSYAKFAFQYGYIEWRAKLPSATAGSQTGMWPALWMLNSTYANQDEIDVVESFGGDQTSIGMTVHNAALNSANEQDEVVVAITPGYHKFGALHQASSISFYVDDQLEKTFDDALPSSMAILIGLQLGNASMGWISGPVPSNWGGGINGPTSADLDIDWIHVWTAP